MNKYTMTVYFRSGNISISEVGEDDVQRIAKLSEQWGPGSVGRLFMGEFGNGRICSFVPVSKIEAVAFRPELKPQGDA